MTFSNATPYPAQDVPLVDPSGRDVVVCILKATFNVLADGQWVPAEEPSPVRLNDQPYEPENPHGSLRYPSDVCIEKMGTDVVVVGSAFAPKPVPAMDVIVRVRERDVPLRVHGTRLYYRRGISVAIGPAAPFDTVPIIYEKAYGGTANDCAIAEPRNWAGVGVHKSRGDLVDKVAPQIEHPARPHLTSSDDHPPVGYGSIMSHWSPRREHAGTFDEGWIKTRLGLLPRDFDVRYNNVAHPTLIFERHLVPGDPVHIMGMSREGVFSFDLPSLPIVVRAVHDHLGQSETRPAIDTLIIEPALRRIEMVMRASFAIGRGRNVLREVQCDLDA